MRLRDISTGEAANAYLPLFIADYNRRFGKPARSYFDAHRPVRDDEDLSLILTWREPRRVSNRLTLQYDKRLYLIDNIPQTRGLADHYVDIYHYPCGRKEIRSEGVPLPFGVFDQLPEVNKGPIVDNKRLGHVLQFAQQM